MMKCVIGLSKDEKKKNLRPQISINRKQRGRKCKSSSG